MRLRLTWPLLLTLTLMTAAFSTGSPVFLTAGLLVLTLTAACILGVVMAASTLRVSSDVSGRTVPRGEQVMMKLTITHRGWIPLAPMVIEVSDAAQGDKPRLFHGQTGRTFRLALPLRAAHVGVMRPGVRCVELCDLLGVCTVRKVPQSVGEELLVLPQPFEVDPLQYAAGESGSESMARAAEDVTSPADVRSYQQGDPMKKVHWKLSMRKQELLVRRYDEPVLPDALVLMDCSQPPGETPERVADVKDALLETAASVMRQIRTGQHGARLPLPGAHPMELDKAMGDQLLMEGLARVDFTNPEQFERVLLLELRRVRTVGCAVVITARLNGAMVDVMAGMRRMGPCVRLYLIAFDPEDAAVLPMIYELQEAGVEVCYVTPMPV